MEPCSPILGDEQQGASDGDARGASELAGALTPPPDGAQMAPTLREAPVGISNGSDKLGRTGRVKTNGSETWV